MTLLGHSCSVARALDYEIEIAEPANDGGGAALELEAVGVV